MISIDDMIKRFRGGPQKEQPDKNAGYCPICEGTVMFVAHNPWLRDHYRCEKCGSIPRERALVTVINLLYPGWRSLTIHESSPGRVSSDFLRRSCAGYSCSHYFPGIAPGTRHKRARCENLEELTFPDRSFDLLVTQDVFEHVNRPERAFSEIGRVLKPGGAHVFTVPIYSNLEKSRPRIKMADGKAVPLLEPKYHGNPISRKGSLVTWDYGLDLPGLIFDCSGLFTTVYHIRDRNLGIDGEFLEVCVSRKRS